MNEDYAQPIEMFLFPDASVNTETVLPLCGYRGKFLFLGGWPWIPRQLVKPVCYIFWRESNFLWVYYLVVYYSGHRVQLIICGCAPRLPRSPRHPALGIYVEHTDLGMIIEAVCVIKHFDWRPSMGE